MTSNRQTITGELRKWRQYPNKSCVVGYMYNDTKGIWFDGEEAVIVYNNWHEGSGFYLAVTNNSAVKCYKDEEDVATKGNPSTP